MELGNIIFGSATFRPEGHELERGDFERTLVKALEDAGFDGYGTIRDERLRRFVDASDLSCEVSLVRIGDFEVMPYFWGDMDGHPDVAAHPNFIDHGSDLAVWWYKYPLRDACANRFVTLDEWIRIVRNFAKTVSTRLDGIPKIG